jgi:hypothetical protein
MLAEIEDPKLYEKELFWLYSNYGVPLISPCYLGTDKLNFLILLFIGLVIKKKNLKIIVLLKGQI